MFKITTTFNGKRITSSDQLKRELKEAVRKELGDRVKRAAQPGVRVSKSRNGFKLEGSQAAVERTMKKLGVKQRRAR